jgi:hypothetical protein
MPEVGDSSRLRELGDPSYQLVTDSQDVDDILEGLTYAQVGRDDREDVTGALVLMGEDDYDEVWLTESNRPYALSAIYRKVV